MTPPEGDGKDGGMFAPGSEPGADTYEASTAGQAARVLSVVIATTCGVSPDHANFGSRGRDGGADAATRAAVLEPERGVAHAAPLEDVVRGERTRLVLILEQPNGWDGTAFVRDSVRPQEPLIDTRSEKNINPDAVQEVRDAVVVTLVLPCQEDGVMTRLNIDLGRGSGATTAKWRLNVTTTGLMQTFGAEEPLRDTQVLQNHRWESMADALSPGESRVNFGPRQWIDDEIKYTAGGKVVNTTGKRQRVRVETDQSCIIVSGGEVFIPENFMVEPDQSFEVVAYTDNPECPPEPATINVQFQDVF